MKTWKKFDYSEKVKLCEKHKRIFDEKVRVKAGRFKCINSVQLELLLDGARNCINCRWETIFGR